MQGRRESRTHRAGKRGRLVDERSSLLGQLRIDHADRDTAVGRPWAWWAGGCVLLVAIGVAGALLWRAQQGVMVNVVTAAVVPTDVSVGPGSLLDASGYVVARRQATVSAKITGKVVEVLIEEGQQRRSATRSSRGSTTRTRARRWRRLGRSASSSERTSPRR